MTITIDKLVAEQGAAKAEGATDPHVRPADQFHDDPVFAVGSLSSLFTVCAMALDGCNEWREDIKDRAIEDVRWTLYLGAVLASDVAVLVAEKGGEV